LKRHNQDGGKDHRRQNMSNKTKKFGDPRKRTTNVNIGKCVSKSLKEIKIYLEEEIKGCNYYHYCFSGYPLKFHYPLTKWEKIVVLMLSELARKDGVKEPIFTVPSINSEKELNRILKDNSTFFKVEI
jgi:hypothetical protein